MTSFRPFVILIGPSGVGKSTFLERLLEDFSTLRDVVTFTTRPMRQGERAGLPYHFVSREEFENRINLGFFVEWAEVHGNLYGTPRDQIEEAWAKGLALLMDVDVQGAQKLKALYPQAKAVFLLPPSIDALRQRLLAREGRAPKDLDLRLRNAEKELALASSFDHQILNDDVDRAYRELKNLIEEYLGTR